MTDLKELCWKLFTQTGQIQYYMLYKSLGDEQLQMDIKVNGIVLTTQEYKDKDVLISIFTAELGKITAV